MTLEIVTEEEAELKPAGQGRDEPNMNPPLDPPKWVWYTWFLSIQRIYWSFFLFISYFLFLFFCPYYLCFICGLDGTFFMINVFYSLTFFLRLCFSLFPFSMNLYIVSFPLHFLFLLYEFASSFYFFRFSLCFIRGLDGTFSMKNVLFSSKFISSLYMYHILPKFYTLISKCCLPMSYSWINFFTYSHFFRLFC